MKTNHEPCPIRNELLARGGAPAAMMHLATAVESAAREITTGIMQVALALDADRRGADAVAVQVDALAVARSVQSMLDGRLLTPGARAQMLAEVAGHLETIATKPAAPPATAPTPTSSKRASKPARRRPAAR